jgi:glycosyltransferase involved in cell wall biosynthesis
MGKKTRILYVVHDFLPEVTAGTELQTFWLTHELSSKFEIFIFTGTHDSSLMENEVRDERFRGLNVRRVKASKSYWVDPSDQYLNSRIGGIFASYLDEVRPALVHVQHTIGLSASIMEVVKSRGVPLVLQMRDFFYMCERVHLLDASYRLCEGPGDGRKCANCIKADSTPYIPKRMNNLYLPVFEQAGIDRTEYMEKLLFLPDLIICPTPFVKEKFVEFGIPARKMRVSPDGVRINQIRRRNKRRVREGIIFAYLGNVSYHKGLDTLIDAFGRLDQKRAELRIYGGHGGGELTLTDKYRTASKDLNVKFFGQYSNAELPEILSQIDVFVLPSICHESYSLVIREAFAAGIPVLVSNIRAQMDAVQNGKNGLHFRAGDSIDLSRKMNLLLKKPGLLNRLTQNTPKVRTIEDQSREITSIYLKLIHTKTRLTANKRLLYELKRLRERISSRNLEQILRPRIISLESERSSLESERSALGSELNQLNVKIRAMETNLSTVRKALTKQESETNSLNTKIEFLKKDRAGLGQQLRSAQAEFAAVQHSFGYKLMKFYSKRIDRLFPDKTARGTFRERVTAGLGVLTERGSSSYPRQASQKTSSKNANRLQRIDDTKSQHEN